MTGQRVSANFVETIDGVVAMPDLERSNAIVSDESEADRFVMGLLRAVADVVVVGSGTMLAAPKGTWRADKVFPAAADAFAELRRGLGKSEHPAVAIVTAGGSFDPTHPVLETGAIVLTTERAAADIRATVPAGHGGRRRERRRLVDPSAPSPRRRARGHDLILSEGGPTLFTSFVAAGLVDELFLTVSPLLGGIASRGVAAVARRRRRAVARIASRGDLLPIRRHGDHLFLRYAITSRRA